jgi:hypothetical protein
MRYDSIRSWEFILNLDGTAECLAMPPSKSHLDKVYPARFRIPPDTLLRLGQEEKNKRSEMFALRSLLYEINAGNKPFEELSDDEVQLRFSNEDFPTSSIGLVDKALHSNHHAQGAVLKHAGEGHLMNGAGVLEYARLHAKDPDDNQTTDP